METCEANRYEQVAEAGKSIAVACKEAEISEQSFVTSAFARRSSTR